MRGTCLERRTAIRATVARSPLANLVAGTRKDGSMSGRIGVIIAGFILTAATVSAQGVEVSGNVGYSLSEGVGTSRGPLLGQTFDRLNIVSGGTFNFTLGVFLKEQMEVESGLQRGDPRFEGSSLLLWRIWRHQLCVWAESPHRFHRIDSERHAAVDQLGRRGEVHV